MVMPAEPGIRASDHADSLAAIEKELRAEDIEHVLLLPAVPD
jgi:hypothetical protein